ncbi:MULTISPECIES: ATP-binding protein [Rhodococcus]|uniref:ATP-binding protein n=1 Tax=Rhodococcus TaxID=1827 RepID=UPI00193BD091|nr:MULTISPECIES: ATP-binding protein [Rhodococcus]QRI74466.1 ATP-binding protein [Rhodococcus aetherivorans]QSE57876.1 ATP-binding protein [Rhodococcus sp. PSBB066]QSE70792.1 ATP-binding protein [Rhodococcus sp. PSBB049]
MAVAPIPVDQRVIGIDSRRFASIEKALVELITNSDDSYSRLDNGRAQANGRIDITYERHQSGAVLQVTDHAEGMPFDQAARILAYGAAHSPLSRGEGHGRGYFGRGLKQAVFGVGAGTVETVKDGRLTRIDLFRGENGGYLYDDHGGDRPVSDDDRERLGIPGNGTRVTLVVENPHVVISRYQTVVQALSDNVYLREVLSRRSVEVVHVAGRHEIQRSGRVLFDEPPALVLIGPDAPGSFDFDGDEYTFTLTLKRAEGAELAMSGDERTNGLVVVSGLAVLDCQMFEYENQVGAEYLFGTVHCAALIERLGQGEPIISDEREGLNHKDRFVAAFSHAVSVRLAEYVLAERDQLRHLEHAITSEHTAHMIDRLLHRMSESAIRDLGIGPAPTSAPLTTATGTGKSVVLEFTTPFYYRRPGHRFHVTLEVDTERLPGDDRLTITYTLPDSMRIDPWPAEIAVEQKAGVQRLEWTVVGEAAGERGEIMVRSGAFWAWCEIVIAENAPSPHHVPRPHTPPHPEEHRRPPRDHGEDMFVGYDLRYLGDDGGRAVYDPEQRTILINTGDPTVQLYLDGRGRFRDAARLLLAELFLDVIAGELARRSLENRGLQDDVHAYTAAKQKIIRRYGAQIHKSFA